MAKILVTIEEKLLARVDREARAKGLNRSAYFQWLASRELDLKPGPGRRAQVRHALRSLDRLFSTRPAGEDATAAIRAERDAR